ncbi:cytochrome p450 [Marasmius crinis-equi]|uniref:Cytochrome p450 n=1 Tax=Marasmius crinis-equi TaxID=585013 RepID=A0ABR3ET51_9AGAR
MPTFLLSILKDLGLFRVELEGNKRQTFPDTEPYSKIYRVLLSVLSATAILYFLWRKQAKFPYPPGPVPRWLIGNLFDIPTSKPWKTYREWSRMYKEDLVHFQVNSQHAVVINTKELSDRMLDKHAGLYSDRPYIAMVEMRVATLFILPSIYLTAISQRRLGWQPFNTAFLRYTDTWRKHRRLYQQGFRSRSSLEYLPIQASKNAEFVSNLPKDPANFLTHIGTLSAATILATVYGYDTSPTDDYLAKLVEGCNKFSETEFQSPATAIVNMFPALRHLPLWLPIFRFQRAAIKSRRMIQQLLDVPFEYVRSDMRSGAGKPSLMAKFLEQNDANNGGDEEQEYVIKAVCATSYGAISMHPDVQIKAQNELDIIAGRGRVPDYEERPNLPYVEAVLRETFRWMPPAPLGVPRAAFDGDVVDGYYIPKGKAMSRDEAVYPNPESFDPERFLNKDGRCNDDDSMFIFGTGRRICPGRHFTSATIWMAMVSVLVEFDIGKPKTVDGKEIRDLEDANYTEGLISHPSPFLCSITPRS